MEHELELEGHETANPVRVWRKYPWAFLVVALLFIIVPFLSWYGTWFGRRLSDDQIEQYLHDFEKPRHVQQAVEQIVGRIEQKDPNASRWYPELAELAHYPVPQVRTAAAWAMQSDNTYDGFHTALRSMLDDPDPTPRHQAALSLVRFGDTAARSELVNMLKSRTLKAQTAGTAQILVKEGMPVSPGVPVVRIKQSDGTTAEAAAPDAGHVERVSVSNGQQVQAGQELAVLAPATDQVWEALRALYIVGQPEDIPYIQHFTLEIPGMPDRIQKQASLTTQAIRSRAGGGS
jgi:hypothetical protein